jgi:DNA repair protein SbcD/Mre11
METEIPSRVSPAHEDYRPRPPDDRGPAIGRGRSSETMRVLHTSDWHVGKTIRGLSRLDEHRRVLGEITALVRDRAVDLVLVAGDLYESAAPSADAEQVVLRALLELHDTGAKVVVIAGNHDNPGRFEAIRPVMGELGITVLGNVARPDAGGVLEHTTASGERAHLALLPFCSQRYAVRAAELMSQEGFENIGLYAEKMRAILHALTSDFGGDAVNLVVAHCMVRGGKTGGGERDAQTAFEDYWIDASSFPATAGYVALGHLHLAQKLPGGAPIWYSGSPIQVDFGEAGAGKHALMIEAAPGRPAAIEQIPLTSGEQLRTLTGSFAELEALASDEDLSGAWLRVRVTEPSRAGLADDVRALLGDRVVEVRIDLPDSTARGPAPKRTGRTPQELFGEYLKEQHIEDDRLGALFARLLDEELSR